MGYKRRTQRAPKVISDEGDGASSHSTCAVPSGRKRRRVSSKKQKEEAQAEALDQKAHQPPTSELVVALKALPRAEDPPPPPPTPSPIHELMEGTLKEYDEECVEEGLVQPDPAKEVGEWEEFDLDQMDTQLNSLLYETCPFHPREYIYCVNPQTRFGQLRFKCPQEGCPVYLFEDSRDTHPQVRARLQRGELKCKCGFVPKMKLSRTSKNHNKVFFSCGSFLTHAKPCGYFQWLHGPLWCPRERAQPTLRQWVHDTPLWLKHRGNVPKESVPLLKGHNPEIDKLKRSPWMNQFGESIKNQQREYETRHHLHKNFGSSGLF